MNLYYNKLKSLSQAQKAYWLKNIILGIIKMKQFNELGLSQSFLQTIEKLGFENPSEIQEKTIPLALAGKDIIGGSATGSGKTLAFSSSIIENLKPNEFVQALILTPTRELAEQVANEIKKFSEKKLNVLAVYGGIDIEPQIRKLAKTDVLVGTPGRIIDHIQRGTLRLDHEEISVQSHVDPSKLKQVYYDVDNKMKFSLLVQLLKQEKSDLVIVFCSTRRNVDFVTQNLIHNQINAKAIHGGLSQNKRTKVLSDFHGKGVSVLVATDVAARGLDIKSVSHVYNYDLPKTCDEYTHRIGRTARAGKDGKVVNLLSSRDYENFSTIQENKCFNIQNEKTPFIKMVRIRLDNPRRNFNSDFKRRNFNKRDSY